MSHFGARHFGAQHFASRHFGGIPGVQTVVVTARPMFMAHGELDKIRRKRDDEAVIAVLLQFVTRQNDEP